MEDLITQVTQILALVDPGVHRLTHQRALVVRVNTGAAVLVVNHEPLKIILHFHLVAFLNVSFQSQRLPVEFLATGLHLTEVYFLDGVKRAKLLGVVVQRHTVIQTNVTGEI